MMRAYASKQWKWEYLGLYDLLLAANSLLSGERYKMEEDEFNSFYNLAVYSIRSGITLYRS